MTIDDKKSSVWDGLSERQIEAISYKLLHPKVTYAELSVALDIPEGTLGRWRLNSMVEAVRRDTAQSIIDYTERVALRAVRVLEDQLDNGDARIAQMAAKEMLDRFMGKTAQRQIHEGDAKKPVLVKVVYDDYNPKTS